jgi:hypothetical protein
MAVHEVEVFGPASTVVMPYQTRRIAPTGESAALFYLLQRERRLISRQVVVICDIKLKSTTEDLRATWRTWLR